MSHSFTFEQFFPFTPKSISSNPSLQSQTCSPGVLIHLLLSGHTLFSLHSLISEKAKRKDCQEREFIYIPAWKSQNNYTRHEKREGKKWRQKQTANLSNQNEALFRGHRWQLYWQYTIVEHTMKREKTTQWTLKIINENCRGSPQRQKGKDKRNREMGMKVKIKES